MDTVPPHIPHSNPIPACPGIYKITCTTNGRFYIGSAINLRARKNHHFYDLRHNKHHSRHLQRAWNKYGEQVFTFEVLEQVLPIALTAREQYWLNKLKPFGRKGFNLQREAGSPLGVKQSPKTREKLRQSHLGNKNHLGKKASPEQRENMRQAQLGKKQSPETREKRRQATLGKKRSPEAIENMRQAQIGRKLSPEHIEKLRGNKNALGAKRSPETREKLRQARIGQKPSPQTIEAARQARIGKPGRKWTPEAIEKRSVSRRGRKLVDGKFV